jgi:peptide/nickel transport system substrate-binding protein
VEIVDKYTVVVRCKVPDSMIPLYLSEQIGPDGMIVPKSYIEKNGNDYFRLHPIGTGPFKLKEHVPGSYILLEAVDKHWALGVPKYKYVKLSMVPEAMARVGLLRRGDVDLISLPLEMVKEIRSAGFPIIEKPAVGTHMLFSHDTWDKNWPISDIRVREALNIAIDRQAINENLFAGLGRLAKYTHATPASIGYEPADDIPYPYNPEKAKSLLKEAGYGPGNPCKITVYSFSMVTFPEAEKVVEAFSTYWKKVGFDIDIKKVPDFGVLKKMWVERTTKGALSPNTIGGRVWSIPIIHATVGGTGTLSTSRIPELDKAIEEAMASIEPKQRAALAHKVFRLIYTNYVGVPLIEAVGSYAANPKTISDWKNWNMGVTMFDNNLEWVLFPR